MIHLIMKDMRLIGAFNIVIMGIAILGGGLGIYVDGIYTPNLIYGLTMVVVLFLVNTLIVTKEFKANSDSLIISMPVKKFDIVKSRYLTMLIYILGTLGIVYLTSNIGKIFFCSFLGSALDLIEIFTIASIFIIFLSFYIPFQYYDLKSAQMFSGILYMFIILSPNLIERFGINLDNLEFAEKVLSLDFGVIGLILIGMGLILYLISLFISREIYETKEF